MGYGLPALRGGALLMPYGRLSLVEGLEQSWGLGTRLALRESLQMSLDAGSRYRPGTAAAHKVSLMTTLGW